MKKKFRGKFRRQIWVLEGEFYLWAGKSVWNKKCFFAKGASPTWHIISDQSGLWLAHFTTQLSLAKNVESSLNLSIWYPDVGHKLKVSNFGILSAGQSGTLPMGQGFVTAFPCRPVYCGAWERNSFPFILG